MLCDVPIGVDQCRRADNAVGDFSVHVFFTPRSVLLHHFVRRVGEQFDLEFVLADELLMGVRRIWAAAVNNCPEFLEFLHAQCKVAGLDGAAGGVVARVEIEYQPLACHVAQFDFLAFSSGNVKAGAFLPSIIDIP